ncbi:MAG: hypothetical protein KAJ18_11945 [Candidatus Omnitrophica bacterium]|nr:hypothetical protein [Candidatus Omnitrophota bacterium]
MKKYTLIGIIILSVFVTGCAGPWKTKKLSKNSNIYMYDTVLIMDNKSHDWRPFSYIDGAQIEAGRTRVETVTKDHNITVSAELKNNRSNPLTVQVQTVFFDEDKYPTGDETNWKFFVIPRQSVHFYTVTSIKPAQHYQIRVRYE